MFPSNDDACKAMFSGFDGDSSVMVSHRVEGTNEKKRVEISLFTHDGLINGVFSLRNR